ncbi:MAG: thiamine-phosphate kinase [Marinilabilia sp.]
MKLSEIGEFGVIERFARHFKDMTGNKITGIGDDCAIMPMDDHYEQVITTDLLIEEIHFLRSKISPFNLGYKSLAVNLSDIAAMGGRPTGSFLSVAIPPDMEVEFMDEFIEGYRALSGKYGVPLLGGDTTKSPGKLVINVCVTGITERGKARMRSQARPGDVVCVTGPLGDSAGGLKVLLANHEAEEEFRPLLNWHWKPEPAVNEGLWLARQEAVHAMIDLSDGIASDLEHIVRGSNTGALIDVDKVPLSHALKQASEKHGWNALEMALTGGEDYRLLVTIGPEYYKIIKEAYDQHFSEPLASVGYITEQTPGKIGWTQNGKAVELDKGGFNHFSDKTD